MAKNIPIAFNKVSLRDLTSYEQIFEKFGNIFNRNKTEPKTIQEQPVTYIQESRLIPINGDSPKLDQRYVNMKRKNSGVSPSKALLPRAEREIKEMNERNYAEDLLIENPDNEQNHW